MSKQSGVNIFIKLTPATHRRLAVLAARLGIGKETLYFHAIDWASRQKSFKDLMEKVYETKSRK